MRSSFLSFAMLVSTISFAAAGVGGDKFWITVDYARFWGNDSLTYVELYYSVPEDILTYEYAKKRFIGGMNISAVVTQEGKIIEEKSWTMPHSLQDTSELSRKQIIVGMTTFALPKGEYRVQIRAYDFYNSGRTDTVALPIRIEGFSMSVSSLSDLELCTSIRQTQADSENVFYKNTLEVVPSVGSLFGIAVPTLFYYVEAYNLKSLPSNSYTISSAVYDVGGKEVIRHEKTKQLINNSSVEVGTLNVGKLKGGTYTIVVRLSDAARTKSLTSSKKFFVYKPGMENAGERVVAGGDVLGSEFAVMQESDLDEDFSQASYIARDAEIKEFKRLSSITDETARVDAKRHFLFAFWNAHKSDALGSHNEFRSEYLKRIQEANSRFTGGQKRGWRTERGRVYVMYGPPDAVEKAPNSAESVPYEMWTYNEIQGGVLFVFIDRTGFGDWSLVHSTHRNELHDDNWMEHLKK